jgi:hypothetical protein
MRMPPAVATAVAALSLGLTLASCAEDAEPTASEADETPSTSSSSSSDPTSPSSRPTDVPSSSEPTATMSVTEEPSPTMSSGTPVDVAARLLPAARMGRLNAEWTWRAGNDFDREPKGLFTCHRFGLDSVGAENVAVREYTSALDAGIRAHHLVAGFPDDVTARRAYSVLKSWRDGCRKRLEQKSKGSDRIKVTDPDPIAGAGDAATSYLVIRPSPTGSSLIDDVAAARDGRVVHLALVEVEGDDYNYPRGRTPAGLAVRNAAG